MVLDAIKKQEWMADLPWAGCKLDWGVETEGVQELMSKQAQQPRTQQLHQHLRLDALISACRCRS